MPFYKILFKSGVKVIAIDKGGFILLSEIAAIFQDRDQHDKA